MRTRFTLQYNYHHLTHRPITFTHVLYTSSIVICEYIYIEYMVHYNNVRNFTYYYAQSYTLQKNFGQPTRFENVSDDVINADHVQSCTLRYVLFCAIYDEIIRG